MDTSVMNEFVIIASVVVAALLGIISDIVASIIQPHLDKRKRWVVSLFVGLLACATVLAIVLDRMNKAIPSTLLATSLPTMTPQCRAWNLAFDFRLAPNQENPNRDSCGNLGVWSFRKSVGSAHDPQTYLLLTNFTPDMSGTAGVEQWQGTHTWSNDLNIRFPAVGINSTNEPQKLGTAMHPAGKIIVHPWHSKDQEQKEEPVVIGWRSPVDGHIAISGEVTDEDNNGGDGILWSIDKGALNLASGEYDNGGKQAFQEGVNGGRLKDILIERGTSIYFVVAPKQDDMFDSTQIDILIRVLESADSN